MLLHMYVIFTSRYCFLSKCAQYDPSCRRALKHYSFIHSVKSIYKGVGLVQGRLRLLGRLLKSQYELLPFGDLCNFIAKMHNTSKFW